MKILLAVDGSAFGDEAAAEVARRPWPAGTEVRVVSVAEPPVQFAAEPYMLSEQFYVEAEKAARERATEAAGRAAEIVQRGVEAQGVRVASQALRGAAARLIVEEAEEWGADLIVLGSHGRGFWGRLLLGSVSQAVAAHAKCSVEIVRARGQANEGGR
jgi:nucleotide-binding universal stress UspA family protein